MPEKSGLDMALRVSLPAGCAAGKIACAQTGVEIADTIATNKRKSPRCTFMLPSLSWLPRQLSDKVYTLRACMEEVRNVRTAEQLPSPWAVVVFGCGPTRRLGRAAARPLSEIYRS